MCFEPSLSAHRAKTVENVDWQPTEDDLLAAGCVIKWPGDWAFKDGVMVATRDFNRWVVNKSPSKKPRFRVKALSVKATS